MNKTITITASAIILLLLAINSVYIVNQTQHAMVLMFGDLRRIETTPGLKVKIPLVEQVEFFDNRILDLNAEPKEVIASDQRRMIVDAFAKYRIVNPLKFYQAVRSEIRARSRLTTILDSSLRQVLGSVSFNTLLTGERTEVMERIQNIVNEEAESLGIEVTDVRIMRTDLPAKNSEATFDRMRKDREKEAKEFRAQGEEEAQRITSKADKDKRTLIADAKKDGEILRGKGDAKALKLFRAAVSKDAEFYAFYRSLQAYRNVLKEENTTMVISPDSEFFHYLDNTK